MGLTAFVITTDKGLVYVVHAATMQRALFYFHQKKQGATVTSIIEAENL